MVYRAYQDSRLNGYAIVLRGFAFQDQWLIGTMLVDSAKRSSGIGHALVEAIVSDARASGAASLIAAVFVARERAKAFWTREGFTREVTRRSITVGDTETEVVRLECSLQPQQV